MSENIVQSDPPALIVRVSEAARLLSVSTSTVWAWANPNSKRHVAGFPIIFSIGSGASGMFRWELEKFLETQRAKATACALGSLNHTNHL